MPPENDSQSRNNDEKKEKSDSKKQSDRKPVIQGQSRSQSSSHATKMGKRVSTIGTLGMIPILLAVGPIIGVFVGRWLDEKFESDPWLTITFVVLGFVAGVRETIQLLKRENAKEDRDKNKNKDR